MKQQLLPDLWLAGAVAVLAAQPVIAQEETSSKPSIAAIPQIGEKEQPITDAKWLTQASPPPDAGKAQVAQITAVQLKPTDQGLEVTLETADTFDEVLTSSAENSLITDIPNAQLRLQAGAFRQDNPTKDIAFVEVVNLDAKTIRVTVTGKAGVPTAKVSQSPQALILSVTAGPAVTPPAIPESPPPAMPAPSAPQQPEAPEALVPQAQEEQPLELTVTAEEEADEYFVPDASVGTRTDTPIRDIPQSVQVIPRQVIEDQQAIGVEEVVENVGGVSFLGNEDGRGLNFAIRGFSNVPVLRDGFRLFGEDSVEPEVANLERVEVLKGPASVLFGEAEPGGLINLVSKQPLSEPFYKLQFQVGNRNLISPSIDLSGPLTEDGRLLYRLNALYRQEDSFRNYDNDFDRIFVGPALTWRISDQTDLTVSLEYIKDDNPADFGTLAFGNGIADIPPERVTNDPEDTIEKEYLNVGYTLEHRFSENWRLRNQFRYISDGYDYSVLALPFSLNESTGILTRVFADQFSESDIYTLYTNVQGNFSTGPVEHTLLAGVDLARLDNENATRFAPDPAFFSPLDIFDPDYSAVSEPPLESIPIAFGSTSTTDQVGIYLQDQVDILDNLIVLAGVRYSIVDQNATDILTGSETSQYDDAFTPRIGIVYQPIQPISLYANYSRSFTPSFAIDAQGQPLQPEEGEGFDIGIKADFFDRLSATLAYFNITKQNVATTDPVNPLASVATGEQRSRGIDLDLIGEILPGWNIVASYAYIDAEVTADNTPELVGNRLSGVPEHSASLWTTYEIQSGNFQGLGFGLGFNFVGAREGDLANSFEADSYFLTNAAVFYRREQWQLRLNVDNLFDANYIESVSNSRVRGVYPGEPMTVRASISVEL